MFAKTRCCLHCLTSVCRCGCRLAGLRSCRRCCRQEQHSRVKQQASEQLCAVCLTERKDRPEFQLGILGVRCGLWSCGPVVRAPCAQPGNSGHIAHRHEGYAWYQEHVVVGADMCVSAWLLPHACQVICDVWFPTSCKCYCARLRGTGRGPIPALCAKIAMS